MGLSWVSQWNTTLALNNVFELKAELLENNCFLAFIWGRWEERDVGIFRDDSVFGFCLRRTYWLASVRSCNNFLFLFFQYPRRLDCEAPHYICWSFLDSLADYSCFKLIILNFDLCNCSIGN